MGAVFRWSLAVQLFGWRCMIFSSCALFLPIQRPIISICWGHRDSRLLMASGPALYVVRVEHRVSSLQLLCQQTIASCLRDDKDISKLTLPPRLCSYLTTAFIPTIKVKGKQRVCKWSRRGLLDFLPPAAPKWQWVKSRPYIITIIKQD